MNCEQLDRRELRKLLMCNLPDVPHYQRAPEERKRHNQFRMRSVACATTLLMVISLFLELAATSAAQVKQESLQRVQSMTEQFETYKKDFHQFGQSSLVRRQDDEYMQDIQLLVVADQTISYIDCIDVMVAAYRKVSSKKDRLAIWPDLSDFLIENTRKRLNQQVQVVNVQISSLTTPDVIAEAKRMRDDLQKVSDDLEGARKEIEAAEAKLP